MRRVGLPQEAYSIDVAVLEGAADVVLLHISGTHGVEGHAGSAIQRRLLRRVSSAGSLQNYMASIAEGCKDGDLVPTVVLVHALNPYGFVMGRRVDQDNVDLNRNALPKEKFVALRADAERKELYEGVSALVNLAHCGWYAACPRHGTSCCQGPGPPLPPCRRVPSRPACLSVIPLLAGPPLLSFVRRHDFLCVDKATFG